MRKLKIAQITNLQEAVPPKNQHGLEQLVSDLTEELVDLGHEVTLFATEDSVTKGHLVPIWPKATRHDPLATKISEETFAIWSSSEAFSRQNEFDVLHSHVGIVASHFSKVLQKPLVSTTHSPVNYDFISSFPKNYQRYFQTIEQEHFSHTHTVAISKYQQGKYNHPVEFIPNGIRLKNWENPNLEKGNYFAFLGYITSDKGASEAIQAILPTNEKLIIAGPLDDNPINQKYFNEKIKPFLSRQIEYIGPLEFQAKKDFLRNAKATLMPIQWDEPFGLVAIESLACATPVISFNRAAMPEIIEDNISGFLVNSVSEMTQKLSQVDHLDRKQARKRCEDHFNASLMAKRYEKLYYEIANLNQ